MVTLRCTQKLLKRMRLTADELRDTASVEPTTALGDWYAHLLMIERQHVVMLVSARSRLCVLTTVRDMDGLAKRFQDALTEVLQEMQVSETAIQREHHAMAELRYGLTTTATDGRSVLGSINDFTKVLQHVGLEGRSLSEWNLYFTRWMCGPLGYKHPGDVARRLLDPPHPSEEESGG